MATGGDELWREAASWLTRCSLLRPDHRANWPQSTIHDLAHTLRDGVLLCNLLNVLDADALDMKDVNQRPQMAQFLCLRNIRVFLRTCHERFELREIDLFDPSMLFDLSNFHRVLCTLAKLSQCPKALAKSIQGFSAHRTQSQEDIYKDLQSIDTSPRRGGSSNRERNGGASEDDNADDVGEYTSYCARIHDEKIYHDLCSVRASSSNGTVALRGLPAIGSRESPFALATSHQSIEKRDYVIRELVDTECNYVDVLGKIIKYFMKPLASTLKTQDMHVIFFGIKELHETHCGFLRQLRLATEAAAPGVAPITAPRLGDVFLTWRERFLLYGDYCSNLTIAQDALKACSAKDDSITKLVNKCQKEHSDGRIQLRDILSVPMQRILKYHLLLDKLVQETQPTHEDFRSLERAKEAMVDVAQYINEVKRDSEVLVLLKNVQESIQEWELPEGTQLKDYGRLLLDGELKIKAHDDQKIRTRYVFIFDKVLVMCKPVKDNQYSFRSVLRLSEYRVEDAVGRRTLRGDARWASQWFLVRRSKGNAFTLYARTDEAKAKWLKALREAIDNLEPAGCRSTDHKFKLHTFDKPETCHHCSKFLKGRIFQGYLCTVCGACAHKACISLSGRCGAGPGASLTAPAAPPHPATLALSPNQSQNTQDSTLHYYMWYVGEMGREMATARLERRLDGTFLLRARPPGAARTPSITNGTQGSLPPPPNPHDTQYALSLKTDNSVKHMRICRKPIDSVPHYFLSESRFFRSVVELISYYERTSLSENFVGLNVVLRWPFRRVVATAIHDFRPADSTQLALRPATKVLVLSKEGDARGWWKGRTLDKGDHRSGYFPKDCVREDPEFLGSMD